MKNGTLYTTASPCELCAKKAYQIGIKSIVYIDPYPGISAEHILKNGYSAPQLNMFTGIIGRSYNKIFEPFMSYKDELTLITNDITVNDKIHNNNIKEFIKTNLDIDLPKEVDLQSIKNKLNELR